LPEQIYVAVWLSLSGPRVMRRPRLGWSRVGGLYSMLMGSKTYKEIPGIAFLVDSRGRRKSVVIDLEQHGSLWEDLYDSYVAQQRRTEPRESLATVKRLVTSSGR